MDALLIDRQELAFDDGSIGRFDLAEAPEHRDLPHAHVLLEASHVLATVDRRAGAGGQGDTEAWRGPHGASPMRLPQNIASMSRSIR